MIIISNATCCVALAKIACFSTSRNLLDVYNFHKYVSISLYLSALLLHNRISRSFNHSLGFIQTIPRCSLQYNITHDINKKKIIIKKKIVHTSFIVTLLMEHLWLLSFLISYTFSFTRLIFTRGSLSCVSLNFWFDGDNYIRWNGWEWQRRRMRTNLEFWQMSEWVDVYAIRRCRFVIMMRASMLFWHLTKIRHIIGQPCQ